VFDFPSWNSTRRKFKTPEAIDLHWRVLDRGGVVAAGVKEPANMTPVNRVARSIAHFEAIKGGRYRVDVDLLHDPCGLSTANPRLIVEAFSAFSEAPVFFLQATLLLEVLFAAPILLSTVPSIWRAVKRQRPISVF
jgi:hypothetical protein